MKSCRLCRRASRTSGSIISYTCPGCATQLQVDLFSPSLGGEPVLWDTRIDVERLKLATSKGPDKGASK